MVEVEHTLCVACGLCAKVCPTGAIHWKDEEIRPKVPTTPYPRRGGFGSYRFLSRQQAFMGRGGTHKDFDELKKRLRDMKKQADRILKRIERF